MLEGEEGEEGEGGEEGEEGEGAFCRRWWKKLNMTMKCWGNLSGHEAASDWWKSSWSLRDSAASLKLHTADRRLRTAGGRL